MSHRGRAVALLVPIALLPGPWGSLGCGGTVIDDDKTEAAIEQNVEDVLGEKVTAVDCPSGVEVEPGERFECTVTIGDGKEETATMKILNEDADIELSDLQPAK